MQKHPIFLFAHGAGKGIHSDWIQSLGQRFAQSGVRFMPFEFPYMIKQNHTGKRHPPDRMPILLHSYNTEITRIIAQNDNPLFIGGKSMGGRIATMVADNHAYVKGCIVFGYPFHPPKKPNVLRTEYLKTITTPTLIVQGTKDPFGTQDAWDTYCLSPHIRIAPIETGNHDLKPLRASGKTLDDSLDTAVQHACDFIFCCHQTTPKSPT